jgi:hypothetical protein
MKKLNLIIFFVICFYVSGCTHDNDTWVAFYNNDTTLVGFKDKNGKVKIAPKFTTYSVAKEFDDIIAVSEFKNPKNTSYYLTKKGRIVGRDSLYYFDNGPDCECEGFIRFRDYKTKKLGMFNANGDIAIPAVYNYLSPVRNGFIIAWKGGVWSEKDISEHNQYPWIGGENLLINITNQVIINNFSYDDDIDFYSLIVSEKVEKSAVRKNFKGVSGKYYSFISFEKEFDTWFKNTILSDITLKNLLVHTYDTLQIQNDPYRGAEAKEKFLKNNFSLLQSKLSKLRLPGAKYKIFKDGLNPYTYEEEKFGQYFDNCGMSKDWIYPVMTVVINRETGQDHFEFLRTSAGYKLIGFYIL